MNYKEAIKKFSLLMEEMDEATIMSTSKDKGPEFDKLMKRKQELQSKSTLTPEEKEELKELRQKINKEM